VGNFPSFSSSDSAPAEESDNAIEGNMEKWEANFHFWDQSLGVTKPLFLFLRPFLAGVSFADLEHSGPQKVTCRG